MPKKLTPDEVRAILERGDFTQLIGAVEDEYLECKSEPYHQVKEDHQKQELAKDVTGFANAKGGVILIGVKTERDPTHYGDEIKAIHSIPQSLIDPNQYENILDSWIYPNIEAMQIEWFPQHDALDKGIVAIFIPEQRPEKRPFLVVRTVDDKGKKVEVVFGYVERKQAGVHPMSVSELQALLRDGLRYDSLMREQFETTQEMVRNITVESAGTEELPVNHDTLSLLDKRIGEALEEAKLETRPALILAAVPNKPIEIPGFLESRRAPIIQLLEDPPNFRQSGFDLSTGATARIIRGQLRRAVLPNYKALDLWRDGSLVFVAPGDADFLGWGRQAEKQTSILINPLVLIESTYLFSKLSKLICDLVTRKPEQISYGLIIRNMTPGTDPARLIPGPLGSYSWTFRHNVHYAPDSTAKFTAIWQEKEIHEGAVAFLLVSELYAWFGFAHDQIPYTKREDNRLVIDPDQILAAAKG